MAGLKGGEFARFLADVAGVDAVTTRSLYYALTKGGLVPIKGRGRTARSVEREDAAWLIAALLLYRASHLSVRDTVALLKTERQDLVMQALDSLRGAPGGVVASHRTGDLTCEAFLGHFAIRRVKASLQGKAYPTDQARSPWTEMVGPGRGGQ